MLKSEQSVEGNNNLQAGRDINQYGISYADAKEIALDIYRNELPYLTKLASDKAWERVEPVLNEILTQIHQKKPEAINEFAEPEVQYMLGSAMKTASSTDDSVVHDVLVRLAVDHILSEERSYERIVDEQAIEVLQKMNREILKSLQEVAFWNIKCSFVTEENLIEYITRYSYSFNYQRHLESLGCVSVADNVTLSSRINTHFKNLISSKDDDIQIQAHRIREIYGMYLHIESSKIQEISSDILGKDMDRDTFNSMIKQVDHDISKSLDKSSWQQNIECAILEFIGSDRSKCNYMDYTVLYCLNRRPIYNFISKVFYYEDEIYTLIQNNRPLNPMKKNIVCEKIFDYELTPVGHRIQLFLPCLLKN